MRIFYSNLSSSIFTLKTLLIVLFTSLPFINQAQEIPSSLIDRANDTRFIFEGVVINSEPYYNSSGTYVYTSNTVEITRLLKGDIECGTIEIITEGGTYNGTTFEMTHSLVLSQGSRGIFLCNETNRPLSTIDFYPESNVQKLEATFENQSFIRYWWDGEGVNAADIWANYDSLAAVYDITELVTGLHYYDCNSGLDMESPGKNLPLSFPKPNSQAVNKKPRYSKKEFNSVMEYHRYKRENFKVEGVNATGTVTYDMENFKISGDSPKFVEFDVTIKDNLGTKYMQFGAVRISYDSFIFGSSIVANNQVTVSRGTLNSDPNCYIDPIPQDHTGSTILISASEKLYLFGLRIKFNGVSFSKKRKL